MGAMDKIKLLKSSGAPGKAEFLSTLKMPPKAHSSRNLMTIMSIVRDMGPNDSEAAWLPRTKMADPPIDEGKEGDHSSEQAEHKDEHEQAMAFDPWLGAAFL